MKQYLLLLFFYCSLVPILLIGQNPNFIEFPLFKNNHVEDNGVTEYYDQSNKVLNEIGDLLRAHGDTLYSIKPYYAEKNGSGDASISYWDDSYTIFAKEGYLKDRFESFLYIDGFDSFITEYYDLEDTTSLFYEAGISTYITLLFDLAHEHGHRQLAAILNSENVEYTRYTKLVELDLLERKKEVICDFIAGLYFRNIPDFVRIKDKIATKKFQYILSKYVFSLGDFDEASEHPMMSSRLAAFYLGLFTNDEVTLPIGDYDGLFFELLEVALLFTSSKSEFKTYDCNLISYLDSNISTVPLCQELAYAEHNYIEGSIMEKVVTAKYSVEPSSSFISENPKKVLKNQEGLEVNIFGLTKEDEYKEFLVNKCLSVLEIESNINVVELVLEGEKSYSIKLNRKSAEPYLGSNESYYWGVSETKENIDEIFDAYGVIR